MPDLEQPQVLSYQSLTELIDSPTRLDKLLVLVIQDVTDGHDVSAEARC